MNVNRGGKKILLSVGLCIIAIAVLLIGTVFFATHDTASQDQNSQTIIQPKSGLSMWLQQSSAQTDSSEPAERKTKVINGSIEPSPSEEQVQPGESTQASFRIDFVDVGQADFAVIECDGQYMTIDGGNAADSQFVYSYLDKRGITDIKFAVITHAHEDHCGAVAAILNHSKVENIYSPVTSYDTKVFQKLLATIEKQGKSIIVPHVGDVLQLGTASIEILGPVRSYTNTNDTSIVLRVTYGDTSYLFAGDAEIEAEADIIDTGCELHADVLKVGHHGSDTATSEAWLTAISPKYAVISSNSEDAPDYGHPHKSILDRLNDANIEIYRTDLQGTITVISDGRKISFAVEK